jgi:hypothetical protein
MVRATMFPGLAQTLTGLGLQTGLAINATSRAAGGSQKANVRVGSAGEV